MQATVKKPPSISGDAQRVAPSHTPSLTQRLTSSIRGQLSYLRQPPGDKSDAVEKFAADYAKLEGYGAEWQRFIHQLATTAVQCNGLQQLTGVQRSRLFGKVDSAIAQASQLRFSDQRALTAEVVGRDEAYVLATLGETLAGITESLVEQVLGHFQLLQEMCLLGSLQWTGDDCCSFFDWQHDVQADYGPPISETTSTREEKRRKQMKVERRHGFFEHNAVRREQHLMQATATHYNQYRGRVPAKFVGLVESIPSFLRPEVQVVAGRCFRTDRDDRKVRSEHWTDEKVTSQIYVHDDPAVVIGETVLFAWEDLDECRDKQDEASQLWVLGACCAALLTVFLASTLATYGETTQLRVATLAGVVSVACMGLGLKSFCFAKQRMLQVSDWLLFLMAWAVVCLGGGMVAISLPERAWLASFAGLILLGGAGWVVIEKCRKWQFPVRYSNHDTPVNEKGGKYGH